MIQNVIRLRACVVVIRNHRLLLFPHINNENIYWYLPGGAVEFGETLKAAAERECLEETGITVRCETLFDVAETINLPYHGVAHVFLARYLSGEIVAENHPVYGQKCARWCSAEEIATLECKPASSVAKAISLL